MENEQNAGSEKESDQIPRLMRTPASVLTALDRINGLDAAEKLKSMNHKVPILYGPAGESLTVLGLTVLQLPPFFPSASRILPASCGAGCNSSARSSCSLARPESSVF